MSKELCKCGDDLNLGVKASAIFDVAKKIGFMEIKDDQGANNFLDLSVDWNEAFWNGRLADPVFASRLLLTPDIEDYTFSITDPNTVTRGSGKVVNLGGGNIKSYEFFIDDADGTLFNALEALSCKRVGIFPVDKCGRVAGNEDSATEFTPKEITSMNVQVMDAFDGDNQRIKVTYSLSLTESQAWDVVTVSDQDDTLLGLDSVCDAELVGTTSVNTTTQTVGVLAAFSSFAKQDIPAEGLDTFGNWTITDSTGAVSVPTLVTETVGTPGEYTIDYAIIAAGLTTFYYLDNDFEVTFTTTVV